MTSFRWRHHITSPKWRYQNDVTKISIFKSPLSKVLVAPLNVALGKFRRDQWSV